MFRPFVLSLVVASSTAHAANVDPTTASVYLAPVPNMSRTECEDVGTLAAAAIASTWGISTTPACRSFIAYDAPDKSWLLILNKVGSSVDQPLFLSKIRLSLAHRVVGTSTMHAVAVLDTGDLDFADIPFKRPGVIREMLEYTSLAACQHALAGIPTPALPNCLDTLPVASGCAPKPSDTTMFVPFTLIASREGFCEE